MKGETNALKWKECPKCKSSWNGGSILASFMEQKSQGNNYWANKTDEEIEKIVKESYSPPYEWSRCIGIEVMGGYDGVSYVQCPDCRQVYDRFTGEEADKKYGIQ